MLMFSPDEYDALTRIDFNVFVERVFVELQGPSPLDNCCLEDDVMGRVGHGMHMATIL